MLHTSGGTSTTSNGPSPSTRYAMKRPPLCVYRVSGTSTQEVSRLTAAEGSPSRPVALPGRRSLRRTRRPCRRSGDSWYPLRHAVANGGRPKRELFGLATVCCCEIEVRAGRLGFAVHDPLAVWRPGRGA